MDTVRLERYFGKIISPFWNLDLEDSEYEFFQQDGSTPPPIQQVIESSSSYLTFLGTE
jgi:hypothetical protein